MSPSANAVPAPADLGAAAGLAPEHAASPALEPAAPSTRRDLLVIAIGSLALFALNVDFWLYGDAALYADYSISRTFTEVTLHFGYYWILIIAQAITGRL